MERFLRHLQKKPLETMCGFSKVTGYQINILNKKELMYLHTRSEQLEYVIKKKIVALKLQTGRKYLQDIYLTKVYHAEYIKNFQNSTVKTKQISHSI